jgi:hypothetical protein
MEFAILPHILVLYQISKKGVAILKMIVSQMETASYHLERLV